MVRPTPNNWVVPARWMGKDKVITSEVWRLQRQREETKTDGMVILDKGQSIVFGNVAAARATCREEKDMGQVACFRGLAEAC